MDREKYRATIVKHVQEILAVHNSDGGWDEEARVDGTSAVYTTGHVLQALMQAGMRPEIVDDLLVVLGEPSSRRSLRGADVKTAPVPLDDAAAEVLVESDDDQIGDVREVSDDAV